MRWWVVATCWVVATAFAPPKAPGLPAVRRRAASVETIFDPTLFTPVCAVSDSFYRAAQQTVLFVVGEQTFQEYAPLIAGTLLRVRLELCVVESFFSEAIVPFVNENGLSWVLPRTETVETFLAGTIFSIALNIIFIGSSKIIAVLVTLIDLLLGLPARLVSKIPVGGGDGEDKDSPVVTTLAVIGVFGQVLDVARKVAEFADVFVARYLAILTVAYIVFKFLHFRVFV